MSVYEPPYIPDEDPDYQDAMDRIREVQEWQGRSRRREPEPAAAPDDFNNPNNKKEVGS